MNHSIRIRFARFMFWGTLADMEAYGTHLVAESKRYAARNDFKSVLAINKDLLIIEQQRIHQARLARSRRASVSRHSPLAV